MQKSKSDHLVFYMNSSSSIILLVVYVDDIVITGSDSKGISSLKSLLQSQFHTKDLGMLRYFLGIKVMRSKYRIFLFQRKYVLDLLSETGKLGVKPCSFPMVPSVHLTREGKPFEDPKRYRRLVGKLNYLTVTRPNISHSVSVVSQYMSSPIVDHWGIYITWKEPQDMVFYIVIMDIKDLSVSRMPIGQDLRRIGGLLQVTISLLEGI